MILKELSIQRCYLEIGKPAATVSGELKQKGPAPNYDRIPIERNRREPVLVDGNNDFAEVS